MENKLEKIGQNSFMDNFVKTDDILKDMWDYRVLAKSRISGCQYIARAEKLVDWLQNSRRRIRWR